MHCTDFGVRSRKKRGKWKVGGREKESGLRRVRFGATADEVFLENPSRSLCTLTLADAFGQAFT